MCVHRRNAGVWVCCGDNGPMRRSGTAALRVLWAQRAGGSQVASCHGARIRLEDSSAPARRQEMT